ncbi:hypothetical protein [Thioflexithrix psekupsensis]|uniref:Uncharacterized protein n=1 Tax=Thioflexithrix psekupsensis TaxID=1570016 RepID=A0A251XD47_9GAMM|nr:hypothetical protein [Thioflexithrix psekupsensis]OUD16064.1 hypothetical protein TPSD3_01270 [Thioflexithrix psekupsensis]
MSGANPDLQTNHSTFKKAGIFITGLLGLIATITGIIAAFFPDLLNLQKKEIPTYSNSLSDSNASEIADFIDKNLGNIVKINLDFDVQDFIWASEDFSSIGISSGDTECIKEVGIDSCGGYLIHISGTDHDFRYSHGTYKLDGYFFISDVIDIHFGFVDYMINSIPPKDVLLK